MREKFIHFYKELHKIPEVGFKEFKTHQYIVDVLKTINCQITELSPTGIIAFFDYGGKDSIAFRAEMDALEIIEKNSFDYISTHMGYMHACGHDGHMAILLAMAMKLNLIKCPRNVVLIFQPSEEKYGGALKVLESNILQKYLVKEIYGLHLWPNLKKGVIASHSKVLMASSTEIDIKIIGKETHIANKTDGIDAIKVAQRLLDNIECEDVVFNCGKISSIGARNIVCGNVSLECSLRTFNELKRKQFLNNLSNISVKIANDTTVNICIDAKRHIPLLKNDLCLFEKHRHLIDEIISPVWQSEDFAFYSLNYRCLFFFLGIGDTPKLHSRDFHFDLTVLQKGLNHFLKIATTP